MSEVNYDGISAEEFSVATAPNFTLPEKEKTPLHDRKCIRYFSQFYNVNRHIYNSAEYHYRNRSRKEQIYDSFAYATGRQRSGEYTYMTQDIAGMAQDQTSIIPGQKVASLIDWMRGQGYTMIQNMELESMALSEAKQTKEMQMFTNLSLKLAMKSVFDQLANDHGIEYNPAGENVNIDIPEDIYRYMENDYREQEMELVNSISQDIMWNNDYEQLFLRTLSHSIIGGVGGIERNVINGKIQWEFIPSWNAIVDMSVDDDFNRKARYAGYISFMTPSEIFTRWKHLSDKEREIINALSRGEKIFGNTIGINDINATNGTFNWWEQIQGQMTVAVVRMYWKEERDLKYKKSTNEYGNTRFAKKDWKEKRSDYRVESWRQGTLIGNCILVEDGWVPNQYGYFDTYVQNDCPIKYYIPNMNMGENRSVVDKLKSYQDRVDAFWTKIVEIAASDMGNGTIVSGGTLAQKQADKMLSELRTQKISVVNLNTGEYMDDDKLRSVFMNMQIGGSPYLNMYVELAREQERIMEEIVNLPKIAMGMQQGYTGMGVQQTSISQSTLGTATLYNGFVKWCGMVVQDAVNVAKYVYTIDDNDDMYARLIVGDNAFRFMKITREFRMEEMQVWFKVRDSIDEQGRERLRAYAQAFSQNSTIDPLDILRIEKARTWTELINDLEYSIKKKERENKAAQQEQQMISLIEADRNREAQMAVTQMQTQASRENTQEKVQGDIIGKSIQVNPELAGAQPQQAPVQ